jgi:transposase
MTRRNKVELFESIRREFEFGEGTVKGVARKFGVHRRMVRQALKDACPPARKVPVRVRPSFDQVRDFIDEILKSDVRRPRKQRHTAHRIYERIREERPWVQIAERTIREYVRERREALGVEDRSVSVLQSYEFGVQGQVDWYEAVAVVGGFERCYQVFSMRSMASGGAFHRAYEHATQQAFFEAHEAAFQYFGGVFRVLRYDNLRSAVQRVLRGRQREEAERFVAFRSHWKFESSFCTPAKGNEKGGIEGEVGYFRRNHWVPLPVVENLEALNRHLLEGMRRDENRVIGSRRETVGVGMALEREALLSMPDEFFDIAEESVGRVDGHGCVTVRRNHYSAPLRIGTPVRVRVLPTVVELLHDGRVVARHPRNYDKGQWILELEHYLESLVRKPGALLGSTALKQWRQQGRWTSEHDQLLKTFRDRHGESAGTRAMIEVLRMIPRHGAERVSHVIQMALRIGVADAAAVRYLITAENQPATPPLDAELVIRQEFATRPFPDVRGYDHLLGVVR